MKSLDTLLRDDLNRLVDRIAASRGDGPGAGMPAPDPALRALMDEAEARLSALRLRLLGEYEEWRRSMDACESLWELARLKGGEVPPGEDLSESEVLRAA